MNEHIEIEGYPNELIQCFINIFNNSVDALRSSNIPKGERYIFISQYVEDNYVYIKFKDNAGGIPQDILPKIFEPYFTTKHKDQGTGLGLHMTYEIIVNHMNGNITAHNDEYIINNKKYSGEAFIIKLPV